MSFNACLSLLGEAKGTVDLKCVVDNAQQKDSKCPTPSALRKKNSGKKIPLKKPH